VSSHLVCGTVARQQHIQHGALGVSSAAAASRPLGAGVDLGLDARYLGALAGCSRQACGAEGGRQDGEAKGKGWQWLTVDSNSGASSCLPPGTHTAAQPLTHLRMHRV
jgi:hypothetical protein